jgi:hypothetical protein
MRAFGRVVGFCTATVLACAGTGLADEVRGGEIIVPDERVAPPPAMAEPPAAGPDYNRIGPYVSAAVSYAVPAFQGILKNLDVDNGWGFNVRGGYRLNEYFAIEGHYEYINDFPLDQGGPRIWFNTFTVNGKLILPLGRFQPFLYGGPGFQNVNADFDQAGNYGDTYFAGRFGTGLDLYLTEQISILLDASYVIGPDDVFDLQYFSTAWGMKYAF